MPFFPSVMLNICHVLKKFTGSYICLFIYSHCHMKNTLSATHFHRHQTTKQFESQGKEMIGGFYVNISSCHSKIWTSAEQSPCWCKWKCAVCLVVLGWAESSQAPSHRGFVVFWVCYCVCQHVGVFMGPSPFVLPSQVQHLQRTGEMNWASRGEHSFPEDARDLQWNHEVTEEPRSGWCAELDHLYLCLLYDYCHWHPTWGWVLTCTIAHH